MASWWSKDTIAVVTGANRGLGLEIVRQLAEKGLTVILTARDSAKGQAAADGLLAKGFKNVVFRPLDISDPQSIQEFSSWLKIEYGWIDILVNNAGVQPSGYDYDSAKYVLDINYFGTKKVTGSMLLLLRPCAAGARVVNVSSRSGLYERLQSESVKKIFREEDNYSEEVADQLAFRYLEDVKAGRAGDAWLPEKKERIYGESKMFLNVYAIALARALSKTQAEGRELFVGSSCPGVTETDMIQQVRDRGVDLPAGYPIKTVAEGADTIVWLALLPNEEWKGKSGKIFAERTEYAFTWNPPF